MPPAAAPSDHLVHPPKAPKGSAAVNVLDDYLVRAHQQDLLRAARIHRLARRAEARNPRPRRSR